MKKRITVNKPGVKKQQKKKVVLTTIAVGAAGVLGYFGWQYIKKQKEKKGDDTDLKLRPKNNQIEPAEPPFRDTAVYPKPKARPKRNTASENPESTGASDFPLKRGSKGDKIKLVQEALIKKHGRSIMPRYGADGFYGAELAAALKKLKLPASIDQSTYNVLVQGHTVSKNNIAEKLYEAAGSADYKSALDLLKTMKNKDDYQTINTQFKTYRLGGVRQTLVNGMLNTFSKEEQKQAIRFEFIRMGLQYDGAKWSLSGLGGLPLITNRETTIWLNAQTGIKVAGKTVLGNEISKRLDYTLFENNGKYFLVSTNATKYLY